VLLEYTIGLYV